MASVDRAPRLGRAAVGAVVLGVVLLTGGVAALRLYPLRRQATAVAPARYSDSGARRRSTLADSLGMSDTQHRQFEAISDETRAKLRALRQNQSLSYQQRTAQLDAIRNEQVRKVEQILTPEQLAKWKARREQARQAGRRARATAPGAAATPSPAGAAAKAAPPAGKP